MGGKFTVVESAFMSASFSLRLPQAQVQPFVQPKLLVVLVLGMTTRSRRNALSENKLGTGGIVIAK